MLGYGAMGQFAIGEGPYALPFPPAIFPDGGYAKKRKRPDPIELELAEKSSRRAALELAVYGEEPPIVAPKPAKRPVINRPPDMAGLAKAIMAARQAAAEHIRAQEIADEEDDLESILKDIL